MPGYNDSNITDNDTAPPRHQFGERFLKGPIPWKWLTLAARLPGKALHVSLALWYLAGMSKKRAVKPSNRLMEQLGVSGFAKSRGLEALEQAGLISVEQQVGKNPIVTLNEPPEDDGSGDSDDA